MTLQEIQNEVAKELKSPFVECWKDIHSTKQVELWPEVCKRYSNLSIKISYNEAITEALKLTCKAGLSPQQFIDELENLKKF